VRRKACISALYTGGAADKPFELECNVRPETQRSGGAPAGSFSGIRNPMWAVGGTDQICDAPAKGLAQTRPSLFSILRSTFHDSETTHGVGVVYKSDGPATKCAPPAASRGPRPARTAVLWDRVGFSGRL